MKLTPAIVRYSIFVLVFNLGALTACLVFVVCYLAFHKPEEAPQSTPAPSQSQSGAKARTAPLQSAHGASGARAWLDETGGLRVEL